MVKLKKHKKHRGRKESKEEKRRRKEQKYVDDIADGLYMLFIDFWEKYVPEGYKIDVRIVPEDEDDDEETLVPIEDLGDAATVTTKNQQVMQHPKTRVMRPKRHPKERMSRAKHEDVCLKQRFLETFKVSGNFCVAKNKKVV